jgi:hypothetical protein
MKFKRNITAALLLAALGTLGTTAFAEGGQNPGRINSVMSEPLRGGDRVNGASGLTINELSGHAPVRPVVPGAREQVKAELAEATGNGDMLAASGLKQKALSPGFYPADPVVAGKTREQVKAELAEAIRAGDIAYGDGGLKRNELFPQVYATQRKQGGDSTAVSTGTARSGGVMR